MLQNIKIEKTVHSFTLGNKFKVHNFIKKKKSIHFRPEFVWPSLDVEMMGPSKEKTVNSFPGYTHKPMLAVKGKTSDDIMIKNTIFGYTCCVQNTGHCIK
jgi:hypothetical protein